jgi:amidohydrolase
MKNIILLALIAFSQPSICQNMATNVNIAATKVEPKVIEWRHDIHQNPELGNREVRTAALIAKHLEALGIEVKTGVAKTGVVGVLKGGKPGPVVALRADMDALPVVERTNVPFASIAKAIHNGKESGVMHACGHDCHVSILMGVAEILAGMKKDLKGTVKFIFQPAEEGAPEGEEGGALLMVKEGVMENPKVDVIFGLHMHPCLEVGNVGYRPKGFLASGSGLKIVVKGKQAHGAQPWHAIDPIVTASQIVNSLQTILSRNVDVTKNPAIVTIGSFHGGNRGNIIPEEVEMIGTVRAFSDSDEKLIHGRIRQIVEHTAAAAGATAKIDLPYNTYYPVTYNDPDLTASMIPSLQKSAGAANVFLADVASGSEDFSYYAQKVPGLFLWLGGMTKGKETQNCAPHHTPDFNIDDSAFKTGMVTLSNLVLDYMEMKKK